MMKLKAGKTILRMNLLIGVAAGVTLVVAIVAPSWAWVPAAVGALGALRLGWAHLSLARIFASANVPTLEDVANDDLRERLREQRTRRARRR